MKNSSNSSSCKNFVPHMGGSAGIVSWAGHSRETNYLYFAEEFKELFQFSLLHYYLTNQNYISFNIRVSFDFQ